MDINGMQEVYFDEYCQTCKYKNVKDHDDPCNECLDNPTNKHSNIPINWEDNHA